MQTEIRKKSGKHRLARWLSRTAALLMVVVFLVHIGSFSQSQITAASNLSDATSKAMEEKVKEYQKQADAAKAEQQRLEREKASVQAQISNMEKLMQLTQDKISAILALLDNQERLIAEAIQQIAEKEETLAKLREKFLERMRITYEGGEATYLEMVLGAKSLSDFLSRVERVGSMLEYDAKLIKQYKAEKQALADSKAALEQKKAEQQETYTQLLAEQGEMEGQIAKYESYKVELDAAEAKQRALYQDYKRAADEENKKLQEYLKELERQQYVGGELMWPVPRNFTYISSPYGPRTLYGMYDFHRGIDIAGSGINGQPVYAANGGTVVTVVKLHYSYGNYIVINHGGGKSTLYAHLSSLNVTQGQSVNKGDIIGKVGSTGNSTGPHLHFEIRIDGVTVDPLKSGLIVIPK